MSEDTPKVDPKYYKPASGAGKLAPGAQGAFSALLWGGIILAAIGVVSLVAGWPFLIDSMLALAAPLLAGAGIVAGLGKRTE